MSTQDFEQMSLDMEPLVLPTRVAGATIQQRFDSFHALNPWVLTRLERLTAEYLDAGHTRVGIGMLVEVIRWQYGRHTIGDAFKLNNDFRSRYVRLMISGHPDWADVFETRELKTA